MIKTKKEWIFYRANIYKDEQRSVKKKGNRKGESHCFNYGDNYLPYYLSKYLPHHALNIMLISGGV